MLNATHMTSGIWGSPLPRGVPTSSPWGSPLTEQHEPLSQFVEVKSILPDVELAGRLISDTISRDDRGDGKGDLLDALESARMSSLLFTSPPPEVNL